MSVLKEGWAGLTPQNRRTVVSLGVLAALLCVLYLFVSAGPAPSSRPDKLTAVERNILTGHDPKALGLDALGANIRKNRDNLHRLDANLAETANAQARQLQQLADQLAQIRTLVAGVRQDADSKFGSFAQQTRDHLFSLRQEVNQAEHARLAKAEPPEPKPGTLARREVQTEGLFKEGPVAPQIQRPGANAAKTPTIADKVRVFGEEASKTSVDEASADEAAVYLPPGSLIRGVLISGVDAPTGLQSKRDPLPALIRIKHQAILPNRFKADVNECFLVVATTGDLSTERALMRGETLSCIRHDGGVIDQVVDSFAVGEDGKNGLRGRLVSRNGSLVAKAAAAGFLEGLANIYRPIAVQGFQTSPTSDTLFQRPDTAEALESAGFSGFSKSMGRLADYYIDMADQVVPFVEIDAGRQVESVLLKGVTLRLHAT